MHAQTEAGIKGGQAMPGWSDLAGREQTWAILDTMNTVAGHHGKNPGQVAIR